MSKKNETKAPEVLGETETPEVLVETTLTEVVVETPETTLTEVVVEPSETEKGSGGSVVTVYGLMIDPITGEVYTGEPKPYDTPSGWVDAQIEAGKMKLV